MNRKKLPDKIILDDDIGYRIIRNEEYASQGSINFSFSSESTFNLLIDNKGNVIEKFNPSREYVDKFGKKIYFEKDEFLEKNQNNNSIKKEDNKQNLENQTDKKKLYETLDEVDEIDNVEIGIKDGRYHRSNGFEFFLAITIGVLLILIIFY